MTLSTERGVTSVAVAVHPQGHVDIKRPRDNAHVLKAVIDQISGNGYRSSTPQPQLADGSVNNVTRYSVLSTYFNPTCSAGANSRRVLPIREETLHLIVRKAFHRRDGPFLNQAAQLRDGRRVEYHFEW